MTLRPGFALRGRPDGTATIEDLERGLRFAVPAALRARVEAAIGAVSAAGDEAVGRWLEARHLIESDRVRAVEAWGEARLAGEAAPATRLLPEARFTCHGCGACCESYTVGPVTEAERARILARVEDLRPHVAARPEAWFRPHPDVDGFGAEPVYALGKKPGGACVFLGPDRLCEVHRRLGADSKPLPCRQFPLVVTRRPDGVAVTIRPECETLWRSREDGRPLEEQSGWVAAIVAEARRALRVPGLVRVVGDVYVPFALARAIERRALGFLGAAPTLEQAHLAIRDLVVGAACDLKAAPEPADLDRADEAIRTAPLERFRAARGPVRPTAALDALADLLGLIDRGTPELDRTRSAETPGEAASEIARFAVDTIRTLRAEVAARRGGPALLAEAARAAATGSGEDDAAVRDFVRAASIQILGSSRAIAAEPGLVFGYALQALAYFVARWGARLRAARRGAAAAGPADWNDAIVRVERAFKLLRLDPAAAVVVTFFAHLVATDEMPM